MLGSDDAGKVFLVRTSSDRDPGAYQWVNLEKRQVGLTSEPDLYRCGVTMAGVFDWAAMIRGSRYERFDNPRFGRLVRKLGDPKQEAEKFEAISPIHRVDAVKVPVLVAHGKEDQVVESSESKRLVAALERHRIPHESFACGRYSDTENGLRSKFR